MAHIPQPNERFRKINFYDGLLLTSEEFKVEQNYHSMVHQMHNRTFHGCGVAWGLDVQIEGTNNNLIVKVNPGVALLETINEAVPVTKELVVTDIVSIDLNTIFDGTLVDDEYVLIAEESEVRAYEVNYKGDQPIHAIDKVAFKLESVIPTAPVNNRVILGTIKLTGQNPNLIVETIDTSTPLRTYSGLNVIEAETHRMIFHPDKDSLNPAPMPYTPSPKFEGDMRLDGSRVLKVTSAGIDFAGYPGGQNDISMDGNVSITSMNASGYGDLSVAGNMTGSGTLDVTGNITGGATLAITSDISGGGNLNVGGNAIIDGNLTVHGTQTTFNTTTMQVEDNIITLNRPTTGAGTSPYATSGVSGIEIEPSTFANAPASPGWPALIWNDAGQKWEMSDYENSGMDIGYGALWDTLSKNEVADALHAHTFLTNGERVAGVDSDFKKLLFFDVNNDLVVNTVGTGDVGVEGNIAIGSAGHVDLTAAGHVGVVSGEDVVITAPGKAVFDITGNFGIGTLNPPDKLYVQGSAGISGDLTVNSLLTVKGSATFQNTLGVNGDLTIAASLKSMNPSGFLEVTNSVISINHAYPGSDAALEVFRGEEPVGTPLPKAQILWDEADDVWKASYSGIDTANTGTVSFSPVEIATVKQLPKSLFVERTQVGHGFMAGDAIYFDQGIPGVGQYLKARSNIETTAGVFIVIDVLDADRFTLAQAGFVIFRQPFTIENAAGIITPGANFTPGQYYFVSDLIPGLLTEKEPVGISNPLFQADSPSTGYVLPYRPAESSRDTLKDYIDNMIVGAINPFAMEAVPLGWFECNGMPYNRIEYSRLFNKIGTTFGAGDGSATFNIPDLRGAFIRGWNNGAGIDPDAADRESLIDGSVLGDHVGTFQQDAYQIHKHAFQGMPGVTEPGLGTLQLHKSVWNNIGGSAYTSIKAQDATYNVDLAHTHNFTPSGDISDPTSGSSGVETRPANISLLYCIKY